MYACEANLAYMTVPVCKKAKFIGKVAGNALL